MFKVNCSVQTGTSASRRALANSVFGNVIFNLRSLFVALMVLLAGCATTDRTPAPVPPVHVSEDT
ncbi:MAG: hypothetical protein WA787_03020, partial [Azonexus sp.]